ncbi:MAG: flagellar motor switch protein FliN [Phycisphaerae bacterium]|nr:flagellar motor switch protein FliN [Phycisphaerae bacterium]
MEAAASSLADLADAVSATVADDGARGTGSVIASRESRQAVGTPRPFEFSPLDGSAVAASTRAIDLLSDVNLNVKIELGRTRMLVNDVLKLGEGSVVELDKLAGDPVDIYVNDRPIARGEVLVLNENFCVRINEILSPIPDGATPTPTP